MNRATTRTLDSEVAGSQSVALTGIAVALLGLFLLWGVGLAHPSFIHNAVHDSRHSMTFPCH